MKTQQPQVIAESFGDDFVVNVYRKIIIVNYTLYNNIAVK